MVNKQKDHNNKLVNDMEEIEKNAYSSIAKAKELKKSILNTTLKDRASLLETGINAVDSIVKKLPTDKTADTKVNELTYIRLFTKVEELTNLTEMLKRQFMDTRAKDIKGRILVIKDKITSDEYKKVIELLNKEEFKKAETLLNELTSKVTEHITNENFGFEG